MANRKAYERIAKRLESGHLSRVAEDRRRRRLFGLRLIGGFVLTGAMLCLGLQSPAPATESWNLPARSDDLTPGESRSLSREELDEGWISLFDGETLYGWRAASDANWRVEDGAITVDQGSRPSLLATTTQFDCFRLSVDFWSSEETNSGIFLRTSPSPADPTSDCIELNIAAPDVSPFPTGSLVGRKAIDLELESNVWRRLIVDVLPSRVVVSIDGQEVLSEAITSPMGRGFVGLQYNQGPVKFRNLFLKPTRMHSLFSGKDLNGWRTYPQMATEASTTEDGSLRLVGGRGQIETIGAYDDFVLQLQARTGGAGMNSGVFFRCIPTEEMNGYEVQIQNEIENQDPTRPVDCGTGGVFRRVDARRVNARDETWFSMTIVAVGPHVSVWVDGLQVTDWHDERDPDLNPRRGLRTEAGTIMLQGHDPGTDVSFRRIHIAEHQQRKR